MAPAVTNESTTAGGEPSNEVVEEPTGTNRAQEPELDTEQDEEPEDAPETVEVSPSGRRLQDAPEEQEPIYSSW